MAVTILQGDALTVLRTLPSSHFDCVVTSPPYWGLRDYGVSGQLGLEPTLGEHLDALVTVFREVRRALKSHGTVWLNYGDCYAAQPNGRAAADVVGDDRTFRDKPFSTVGPIYNPDHQPRMNRKANVGGVPMPESVYDRPATAHEKIWLLAKSEDYFYNHEAIREAVTGGSHARVPGPNSRQTVDRVPRSRKLGVTPKSAPEDIRAKGSFHASTTQLVETRNARNVWTIAPKPFREAHFATFPPALAERCIMAGVHADTCGLCGEAKTAADCGGICASLPRSPGRVLDPFGGAGTVGLVADHLGLDCTLIELNPEYAGIARRRIWAGTAAPAEVA